jgi:hypothetical protein
VQPRTLSGWKNIANYLGKGVRTAQRYERKLALAVRRPASKTTGSVVAVKYELDAWVASHLSMLSIRVSLKNRTAELNEIASHTKKLMLEIRAFRERLSNPVRQIEDKVKPGTRLR